MSDCINTVTSLMPSSSSFDGSDVQEILDHSVGLYFDDLEERIEDVLDAPFLTEATGDYLDILHGKLYGIKRIKDESDDDYRARLSFQAKDCLRIPDLQDLGCKVYSWVSNFGINTRLTSRNTSLYPLYIVVCPNSTVEQLIRDNFINNGVVIYY